MTEIEAETLSGCDALHDEPIESSLYDSPEQEALRPLFPRGVEDEALAEAWSELFEVNPDA